MKYKEGDKIYEISYSQKLQEETVDQLEKNELLLKVLIIILICIIIMAGWFMLFGKNWMVNILEALVCRGA